MAIAEPQHEVAAEFDARRRHLDGVLRALKQVLEQLGPQADAALVKRLTPIVDSEVARLELELSRIEISDEGAWRLLADLSDRVRRMSDEILAFVGGLAARGAGLDRESCVLADRLVSMFGGTLQVGCNPVTLPSASEYIDTLSEVIRVRFPGRGFWDLPIVMHEFGHLLALRFRNTRPGEVPAEIFARERDRKRYLGTFAEEYWADVFATYAGGPAYAFTALSRFQPVRVRRGATHPAPIKRAIAIFRTLETLQDVWENSGRSGGTLRPAIDQSREKWLALLACAGIDPEPEEQDRAEVSELTDSFIAILDREHPKVRYVSALGAARVRRFLAGDGSEPDGCSPIDVLNGAWWLRGTMAPDVGQERLDEIEAAARSLFARELRDA